MDFCFVSVNNELVKDEIADLKDKWGNLYILLKTKLRRDKRESDKDLYKLKLVKWSLLKSPVNRRQLKVINANDYRIESSIRFEEDSESKNENQNKNQNQNKERNDILVVVINEEEEKMKMYLQLYEKVKYDNIQDVIDLLDVSDKYCQKIEEWKIMKMIKDAFPIKYWKNYEEDKKYRGEDISYHFANRRFPYDYVKNPSNLVKDLQIKKEMEKQPVQVYPVNFNEIKKYMNDSDNKYKPLQLKDYNRSGLTMNHINWMIERLTNLRMEKSLIYFIGLLLISREFTHLILKNISILRLIKQLKDKYKMYNNILTYCMYYGFYFMDKEELCFKSRLTSEHRCVFDISEGIELPIFTDKNPYMIFPVKKKFVKYLGKIAKKISISNHNINNNPNYVPIFLPPLPPILNLNPNPIHPIQKSIDFTYGIVDLDTFRERLDIMSDGIFRNINFDNIRIVGSAIEACLIKSPLDHLLENFQRRLEVGYKDSDVDIAVIADDEDDFKKRLDILIEDLRRNDPSIVVKQKEYNLNGYTVERANGKRSLDIFYQHGKHTEGLVFSFHFGSVRAYYDGNTVKMLPSFLTVAYSGIIKDYRYMSSTKDPLELIIGRHRRGFGFYLNNKEMIDFKYYIQNSEKMRELKLRIDTVFKRENDNQFIYGHPGGIDTLFYNDIDFMGYYDDKLDKRINDSTWRSYNHCGLNGTTEGFSLYKFESLFKVENRYKELIF